MGSISGSSSADEGGTLRISESLIPQLENKVASTTEVSIDGLLEPPLLLKEDLKEGCGGQLWPAGMVLAKYMLRYRASGLAGKTILELGAGGGLVGLAVARGCNVAASSLYITDQLPMLALMRENIQLNNLSSTVTAAVYDWGTTLPPNVPEHSDIVLAADCVYFEPAFPLLLETLGRVVGDGTVCYFCFKKRRKADWRFVKSLKKTFEVRSIDEDEDSPTYRREGIYLYEVTRKKSGH